MSNLDFAFEVKRAPDGEGRFSGLAAVFGNIDRTRDIIEPGAFAKSLRRRPAGKIKLLAFHNPDEPIGVIDRLEETDKGLAMDARLARGVQRADEVYELMKMGALDSLSIGYTTKQSTRDPKTGVRRLKEIELFEVSVVSMPANEAAAITLVKAADQIRTERDFEQFLRRAGFSRKFAELVLSVGYAEATKRTSRDQGEPDSDGVENLATALRRCRSIITKGFPDDCRRSENRS
jgi:Escherichia/Staphylococcus phage prohead protease